MTTTLRSSPAAALGFAAHTVPLEPGDEGTAQTIALIGQVVRDGVSDPYIRAHVLAIARLEPTNDIDAQARAIYEWAKREIRFVTDGVGVETIQDPRFTLHAGAGDCDCITTLLCALLGSIGIPTRLVTVATEPGEPNFTHIYPEYLSGDGQTWIAIDVARTGARFGRCAEPGSYHRMRVWWFDPAQYQDVQSSGEAIFPGGLSALGALSGGSLQGMGDFSLPDDFDIGDISPDFGGGGGMWDANSIISAITAGGNSAANIIRSIRSYGLPQNLVAAGYRSTASGQLVLPDGRVLGAQGSFNFAGLSSSTVVWGALGLGVGALAVGMIKR